MACRLGFGVGVSTAIVWVRRFRANGEATARRQGKPRGSRLDAHADFILTLVEADTKDARPTRTMTPSISTSTRPA